MAMIDLSQPSGVQGGSPIQAYAEVIGDPIGHSLSPHIHGFWLNRLGLGGAYRATHVVTEALNAHVAARRADPLWRGMNVTLPHKIAVRALVDRLTPRAERVGAVNLVVPRGGALVGDNSDMDGFLAPLDRIWAGQDWSGKSAVVFGAGGAARAVVAGLAARGLGGVILMVRTPRQGLDLLDALSAVSLSGEALRGETRSIGEAVPRADLLVNATSLGMVGKPPLLPDLTALPGEALVYDLIYTPRMTPLLVNAAQRGLKTLDGMEMLIGQAAIGFEMFFGRPAPTDPHSDYRLRAHLGLAGA